MCSSNKGEYSFLNEIKYFLKEILKDYKLSRLRLISKTVNGELEKGIRETQRIRMEMQGMGWECSECGWKCKNTGNQGSDERNQGGNLGIAVEMT